MRPWEGTLGATFSDELLDMGEGYGIKYEQAATPPSILAIFAPWRGSRENAELMQSLRYTAGYGALQRARDGGEIVRRPTRACRWRAGRCRTSTAT